MYLWQNTKTVRVVLIVLSLLLVANMGLAGPTTGCRIDWNENGQITEEDYLVGDPMGGFYAEWYIHMYYPSYYPVLFPGEDSATLDYDRSGVIDEADLMGPLDAALETEGFYVEWYIWSYYPSYYPIFVPGSVCGLEQSICPGKDDSIDLDADGRPDCIDPCVDADSNGICDRAELCPGEDESVDLDDDSIPDCADHCIDQDGDGVCNADDQCPGEHDTRDQNQNGTPDCIEIQGTCDPSSDIDGDGANDCVDGCPLYHNKQAPGICGCNGADLDSDGDGVLNCNDGCPYDSNKTDPGICGCDVPESTTDSDGDGVKDCVDLCPLDSPDDPDNNMICGLQQLYCAAGDDLDMDNVCNAVDQCIGNDAAGDSDADGWCDDVDECVGDDLVGDSDGDGVCDDQDACVGYDGMGDWDEDGLCNDQDSGCSYEGNPDADGDGICNLDDPCPNIDSTDFDADGFCIIGDPCRGDHFNDVDKDGLCTYEDGCPLDKYNDADRDGLCGNIDMCFGDNSTGDDDGDGYCGDVDICIGDDIQGDTDGDGYCDSYTCPGDVPAFYDQQSDLQDWIAGGVCVETAGIDGPPACPQSTLPDYTDPITWITTNYPFTASIIDGTGVGQSFGKDPYKLLCSGFEARPESARIFDDINSCYHATSECYFDCSMLFVNFEWGANVWDLLSVYNQRAAKFGGSCSFNQLIGAPTGFHAESYSGMILWTVDAGNDCDYYGCRCDATLEIWSNPANPGWYQENSLTNNSKFYIYQNAMCEDQRFNF